MHNFTDNPNDATAALMAGQLLAAAEQKPHTLELGGIPFVIGSDGRPQSLEAFLPIPVRLRANVALDNAASFIAYVNRFKTDGTLIFVTTDLTGGKFTASLDYPKPGGTSWRKHHATLKLVPTPDWQAWIAANNKWQAQEAFCEFVEKYRHVFSEPTAADMLEISRNVEAKKDGNFKSGIRLANGDRQLLWEERTTATAGVNKIEIPEEITICLAPFEGGQAVMVSAFLRFRIQQGVVTFLLELQRPEEIIRLAVQDAQTRIAADTDVLVLAGGVSSND